MVTGRKSTRKHSEVEEGAADPVKPAAVIKTSKPSRSVAASKYDEPREGSSSNQQTVIQPVPAAPFAVVSAPPLSTGRNSAASVSSQVLTIVIDTTSHQNPKTSSSSSSSIASQITAAENHASELKAKAAQLSADQLASEIKASQLLAEKKGDRDD